MAAPYRSGVVVRAGKPVEGIGMVLGRGTYLRGRVTVGADRKPAAGTDVRAFIDKGSIPAELRREGDHIYHHMNMQLRTKTDPEGRFEFLLGPGEYTIRGPARVEPIKVTIPAENPPRELVHNLVMPRPETGPFRLSVVDADGKPVAGAVVDGSYQSMAPPLSFGATRSNAEGLVPIERSLDPLVIEAATPDGTRAGIVRVDATATEAKVVVKPTATASGRVVDTARKPVAGQELEYGIIVHKGPSSRSPFSYEFGGTVTTDERGKFALAGLVVGETYQVRTIYVEVKPTAPGPFDLGDFKLDLDPPAPKPYVPPTPAERAAESFAARKEMSPRQKLAYTLTEAKRENTRPLLLFGSPADPACIDLFRLFEERPDGAGDAADQSRPKSPADLRWEFELASLDTAHAAALALARELGLSLYASTTLTLTILSLDGKPAASYPLRLGAAKTLDARALVAFLLEQKLPTRDAEAMLADALAQAKAEDKRVFLIMSASWCGPCRMLARYLAAHKTELERHYVFVKLDVSRDTHADDLRLRYEGKDAANGIPWYVILEASGKPLITSSSKELEEETGSSNIGFPSSPKGIDHFAKMLTRTAPGLSADALAALRQALTDGR
jgi:thiol-disulfide isomerase/thioredoxin